MNLILGKISKYHITPILSLLICLSIAVFADKELNAQHEKIGQEEKVPQFEGASTFSIFHASPENPSGTLIAYNTWDKVLTDQEPTGWVSLWVCNHDLTNHRLIRKHLRKSNYHNGSAFVWVNDHIILTKGLDQEGQNIVMFIDITTGKDVVQPIRGYTPDLVRPGLIPMAVHGSMKDSRLGPPGVYLYDLKTDSAKQIVSLKTIHEKYVDQLIGSDNMEDWRIFHTKISTRGSYLCFNVHTKKKWSQQLFTIKSDGTDLFFWGHDKPSHFFFFDDDSLMGVDGKVKDGLKDDGSLRVWTMKKKVKETFNSGTYKHAHNAVSPDRQLAASDQYQRWAQLDLYRRGESKPALNIFKTKNKLVKLLKDRKGHINPAFSRDGKYLYYSRPINETTIQAYRFRIPDELLAPKSKTPQSYDKHSVGLKQQERFDELVSLDWQSQFEDKGQANWQERWFVDGKEAKITQTEYGFDFNAGEKAGSDQGHAVLWTRQSFSGNLLIRYTYTRQDQANKYVNIAYLYAQGDGQKGRDADISKWAKDREVASMKQYFGGMNLLHISYAAFTNDGRGKTYIRGRRYDSIRTKGKLNGTELKPDYSPEKLFETGVEHRITILKHQSDLFFLIENDDTRRLCHWDLSKTPALNSGRFGLRHMASRKANYSNISISQLNKE